MKTEPADPVTAQELTPELILELPFNFGGEGSGGYHLMSYILHIIMCQVVY